MILTTQSPAALNAWRAHSARRGTTLAVTLALPAAVAAFGLMTGPSGMSAGKLWQTLVDGPFGSDPAAVAILFKIRMPQTSLALIVGAALGLAGLMMQLLLANPLASPFSLGFSAAAGFGVAMAIMFGATLAIPVPDWLLTSVCAFMATLFATANI